MQNLNESIDAKPIFEVGEKLPLGVLSRITYPICNTDKLNANNRVYPKEVFEKVLGNQDIAYKMKNRTLFGESEHPLDGTNTRLDGETISHIVTNIKIDEKSGIVYATFDNLDTPAGRFINTLLLAECQVGCSTRAEGEISEDIDEATGNKCYRVVPESYQFRTVDYTADPSTFGALPEKAVFNSLRKIENGVREGKIDATSAKSVLKNFKGKEAVKLYESISNGSVEMKKEKVNETVRDYRERLPKGAKVIGTDAYAGKIEGEVVDHDDNGQVFVKHTSGKHAGKPHWWKGNSLKMVEGRVPAPDADKDGIVQTLVEAEGDKVWGEEGPEEHESSETPEEEAAEHVEEVPAIVEEPIAVPEVPVTSVADQVANVAAEVNHVASELSAAAVVIAKAEELTASAATVVSPAAIPDVNLAPAAPVVEEEEYLMEDIQKELKGMSKEDIAKFVNGGWMSKLKREKEQEEENKNLKAKVKSLRAEYIKESQITDSLKKQLSEKKIDESKINEATTMSAVISEIKRLSLIAKDGNYTEVVRRLDMLARTLEKEKATDPKFTESKINEEQIKLVSNLSTKLKVNEKVLAISLKRILQLEKSNDSLLNESKELKKLNEKLEEDKRAMPLSINREVVKQYTKHLVESNGYEIPSNTRTLLESCGNVEEVDAMFIHVRTNLNEMSLHSNEISEIQVPTSTLEGSKEDDEKQEGIDRVVRNISLTY